MGRYAILVSAQQSSLPLFYSFHHLTVSRKREFSIQYSVPLLTKNSEEHPSSPNGKQRNNNQLVHTCTVFHHNNQHILSNITKLTGRNPENTCVCVSRRPKSRKVSRNVSAFRLVYTNVFISAKWRYTNIRPFWNWAREWIVHTDYLSFLNDKEVLHIVLVYPFCTSHLLSIWIGSKTKCDTRNTRKVYLILAKLKCVDHQPRLKQYRQHDWTRHPIGINNILPHLFSESSF